MKLTGTKDTSTHVTLRAFAQILVLIKDLLVKFADVGKLLVWGVLVSVNLILNFACCWSCGNHALNIKEIVTVCQSQWCINVDSSEVPTYVHVTDVVG